MNIHHRSTDAVKSHSSAISGAVNPYFHKPTFHFRRWRSQRWVAQCPDLRGQHVKREHTFRNCGSNDAQRVLVALLTRVERIEKELVAMQIPAENAERLVGG